MNIMLRILLAVLLLAAASCRPEETEIEDARVREEIERRVELMRRDLKTTENTWHTIRVSAYCILAGACLIWLLGDGGSSHQGGRPRSQGGKPVETNPGRRIIDRDYDPYEHEREDDPYHR